ncbi:MAG: hypothetical protein K8953_03425, partial [Proteobacteria bacterium]|nr:hypothetical protein [Pseudomonadota bacterium]
EYEDMRQVAQNTCLTNNTKEFCDNQARIATCDADEFAPDCAEPKYVDERRMACTGDKTATRCMPTVELICGATGDIFDDFCTGLTDTDTMRASACQTHGTDAGGDDSCAASLASSCTITDPFMYAGCKDVAGIAEVRMMYCQTPATAWDGECMDTTHGTVTATRMTACEMFGTGMGGDDSCAARLASSCTMTDPFIYPGCKDVEGIARVRMMYCQTPATAWDGECMETTHGAVDATRVMACQMFGTDTDSGGDDSCATSLTTACDIRDPFAYIGCNNVEGIAEVRMMYCQAPATAWDEECMDGMHGTVNATRVTACQMFGTNMGGDNSCATSLAPSCTITDPFIYPGCDNVA